MILDILEPQPSHGTEWLIVGAFVTVALLLVGHWFPWPERLRRLQAYVYGVFSIVAGFAVWRGMAGDWQAVIGLVAIVLAGGVSVFGAYAWDNYQLNRRKVRKAEKVMFDDRA